MSDGTADARRRSRERWRRRRDARRRLALGRTGPRHLYRHGWRPPLHQRVTILDCARVRAVLRGHGGRATLPVVHATTGFPYPLIKAALRRMRGRGLVERMGVRDEHGHRLWALPGDA